MAVIRLSYVCAFAALASLGEAAAARPAWLWMKSQGLFRATLARDVPFGALLLGAGALLGLVTLRLASGIALRRRPGPALHAALVLLAGICCSLRHAAGGPRPSPDPGPALLEGLRAAAAALDAGFAGQYLPEVAALAPALARGRLRSAASVGPFLSARASSPGPADPDSIRSKATRPVRCTSRSPATASAPGSPCSRWTARCGCHPGSPP